MKKYISNIIISLGLLAGVVGVLAPAGAASAAGLNVFDGACGGGASGGAAGGGSVPGASSGAICGANKQDDFSVIMKNVINTVLVVLGMIAVIMIVVGGIKYTTSNGDSAAIQSAKNTILYAIVGLIVAILSFAIVNFILDRFKG